MADPNKILGRNLIALICANDAFILRRRIATLLWEYLESNWDFNILPRNIEWLTPKGFMKIIPRMIEADISVLKEYWEEVATRGREEKDFWNNLESDNGDHILWDPIMSSTKDISEPILSEIASRVIRLSTLRDNIKKLGSFFIGGIVDPSKRDQFFEQWMELFAVLIVPVTRPITNYYLHTLCPDPKYKGIHNLHSTTDEMAYKYFQNYTFKGMQEISCDIFRNNMQGGIRSLNCCYFNNLKSLTSRRDHPAALLIGCRSGAQIQILAENSKGHRITGMVGVYFPFYDFWQNFNVDGNGSLLAEHKTENHDKVYETFWETLHVDDLSPPSLALARRLVGPLRENEDCKSIIPHMSGLSTLWDEIQDVKEEDLPESVTMALRALESGGFNTSKTYPLIDWFESLCAEYGRIKTGSATKPKNNQEQEKILETYREDEGGIRPKIEKKDSIDDQQQGIAFIPSANEETHTESLESWAGNNRITLAIAFTDVVGSTAIGEKIKDEQMSEVQRAHFAQSRKFIEKHTGREIKRIGDSLMLAFKDVSAALDYALAFQEDPGHSLLQIRVGIHIGPVEVKEEDVFGRTVNFAHRVIEAIKGAEIWLSDEAKKDVDTLGAKQHNHLKWRQHDGMTMKGFPGDFKLWSLEIESKKRRHTTSKKAVPIVEKIIETENPVEVIRMLHLSDLQFDKTTHVEARLQCLVDDIRHGECLGFDKLDYLVISGDFSERGCTEGFNKAHKFISDLIEEFELSTERCVFVPGNHDLTTHEDAYTRKKDSTGLPEGEWVKEGRVILARSPEKYPLRFMPFSEHIFQKLLKQPYPIDYADQGMVIPFWETGLLFLALNSCWEIDEFYPKRSGIHPDAVAHALKEADQKEKAARAAGLLAKESPLLRIAVWHHAATGPNQMTDVHFLEHLQKCGVRLALHGDWHDFQEDLGGNPHEKRIHIIGSGSFGSPDPAKKRGEAVPRLYNLLEIRPNRTSIRVHTRHQIARDGAWKPWNVWSNPAGGDGKLPYHDIKLT